MVLVFKFRYVRGSLRPDRGSGGGAEDQIYDSPQLHRSISARSGYVFVLIDANARTGKRGEGGGEADIEVLSAYGQDVLNKNGKLLLGLAEDNKLILLNTFFCSCQSRRTANSSAALMSIGPLKTPESVHNLVCAKVRTQRRSAPNRRKRDSTKETPKLVGLKRLMTDPNLRCQVANAMVDALPPIPDGTCISDIVTDMVNVMLSPAAELVPRSKRLRGVQGWCAGLGVETGMSATW